MSISTQSFWKTQPVQEMAFKKVDKYIIHNGIGKRPKKKGIKIVILKDGKSRCLTVHGYSVNEVFDLVYFTFYNDNKEGNDEIVKESVLCRKIDKYLMKRRKQRKGI